MITVNYEDIERRVDDVKSTMAHVCRRADIPHQSWIRWKTGTNQPNLGKLNTILAEVEKLEKEFNGDG